MPLSTRDSILDLGSATNGLGSITNSAYRQIARELHSDDALSDFWVDAPEEASSFNIPPSMKPSLANALGVPSLYSHQIAAWSALRAGKSIVLQTPTASGKTVAFNPHILQSLMDSEASALYLFPLKALCQDQVETLEAINAQLPKRIKMGVMTGDTSPRDRDAIWNTTQCPQLVVFNPDVLNHFLYNAKKPEKWQKFREYLRNLKFVVVDEAHTYQGIFGSHFTNLRRRLELLVDHFGGDSKAIQYVFATATVANGAEMIEKFSGRSPDEFRVIDKSGAGDRGRVTLALKPQGDQVTTATEIAIKWFRYGITGIIFCNSRAMVKTLTARLRKELGATKGAQVDVYYGGMNDSERTRVLAALRSGRTKVVVSTSALEAGINIPALDACLVLGFAGSIMAHRQRIGRSGRKSEGLVIFSPSDRNALDAFYGREPRRLLGAPERISFNPQYESVLAGHLCAAAAEGGIPVGKEDQWFGEGAGDLLRLLAIKGWGHDSFDNRKSKAYPKIKGKSWTCPGYPHMGISIRGSDATQVTISCDGKEIEVMDRLTAIRDVYTGAIYTSSQSGTLSHYRCDSLDMKSLSATVKLLSSDRLRTRSKTGLNVKLHQQEQSSVVMTQHGNLFLGFGWGKVTNYTSGYKLMSREARHVCVVHGEDAIVDGYCTAKADGKACGLKARLTEKETCIDDVSFEKAYRVSMTVPVLEVKIDKDLVAFLASKVESLKQEYAIEYQAYDDFDLPREVLAIHNAQPEFVALHSLAHQINLAFPTMVLGSQHDIDAHVDEVTTQAHEAENEDEDALEPDDDDSDLNLSTTTLWLYDTTPGGSGAIEQVFNEFEQFVEGSATFAASCECAHGCPNCLSIGRCGQRNEGLNKQMGMTLSQIIAQSND